MRRLCFLSALAPLLCSSLASAQGSLQLSLKPVKPQSPPYEAISFVSEGAAFGHTDGNVRGRYNRVLLVTEGLAYDRPTIRLETLTYGDEGCCRKVVNARELNLEELQAKGIPLPDAATTELRFVRWLGAGAIELSYGSLRCQLRGIEKPQVSVSCKQ